MVLTYDAYSETLEKLQQKESEDQALREDIALLKEDMRFIREGLDSTRTTIMSINDELDIRLENAGMPKRIMSLNQEYEAMRKDAGL
jgi:hypothetical protein